ncbi:hypothetical protein JCM10003_3971 [Bacteroides pyogenes JCM 10003]|nr:hypothetical protein JCM10003_3971 [Bacteroides pyogenes JCM 10003]
MKQMAQQAELRNAGQHPSRKSLQPTHSRQTNQMKQMNQQAELRNAGHYPHGKSLQPTHSRQTEQMNQRTGPQNAAQHPFRRKFQKKPPPFPSSSSLPPLFFSGED